MEVFNGNFSEFFAKFDNKMEFRESLMARYLMMRNILNLLKFRSQEFEIKMPFRYFASIL